MRTKGRRFSPVRASVAFLAVIVLATSLCCVGCSSKKKANNNGFVVSRSDTDGVSYAFVDGVFKTLGEVGQVIVTPDRSHHLVLSEEEFIVYGKKLTSPKHVYGKDSDGKWSVSSLAHNGALVTCEKANGADTSLYRVYYSDCKLTPMDGYGEWIDYEIAENTVSIAYVDRDGGIFVWCDEWKSPVKIAYAAEGAKNVDIVSLSKNGSSLIWCEDRNGSRAIRGWIGGKVSEICSYETDDKNFSGDVYYTKDAELAVICDYDENSTYICEAGKAAVKVKLEAEDVLTKNGSIDTVKASEAVKGLYLVVEENDARSLYFVGINGEREKVVSDIKRAEAYGGQFFYIDSQNTLRRATASGGQTFSGDQIAENAVGFRISENGKYVYYVASYADSKGTLGRYDVKSKSAATVDEDVYGSLLFELSSDGKTVFYYKNVTEIKSASYGRIGELYVSTVGKKNVKVASDAVIGTADSGIGNFFSGEKVAVKPKAIAFLRYDEANNGGIIASWMLYDGAGLKLLADNIICE